MSRCALVALLGTAVVGFGPSGAGGEPPAHDTKEVVLTSGTWRLVPDGGFQRIEMDGFECLPRPGEPRLPSRRFLIALPPGARVESVESHELEANEVSGTVRLRSVAPLLSPAGPEDESGESSDLLADWHRTREAARAANDPRPERLVRLVGTGTLRKYAYAAIAFCPFRYRARSGGLVHHPAVEVTIHYRLPRPGSPEAQRVDALRHDTIADEKAARLFVNYPEVVGAYRPPGGAAAPRAQAHDYVIVASPPLAGAIAASGFPAWKTSLGRHVRTVLTTDPEIAGQPGGWLVQKIRNFLRSHYGSWGIEHVLLVGASDTVPMRYCYPNPEDHTHHPNDAGSPGGSVPTDAYYADLSLPEEESWDLDGDGFPGEYGQDAPDFLAEVSVGRIPTNDPARVTYALNKLVDFEQGSGPWKGSALHGGAILFHENENHEDLPKIDGARCMAQVETDLMEGWAISHRCEHEGLEPSDYPWPPLTAAAFTADWRDGQYGVVNWSGHGSARGAYRLVWTWDDGDGVFETDGSDGYEWHEIVSTGVSLEDDHPSIVFAVSCSVGYPEPNAYGNLGVDLLTAPGFGASAGVLAASRSASITADWPASPGGAESFCYEFNRFLIAGPQGPARVGDALYDAKCYCNVHFARDHYYEYKNLYDYNLYGDPALVLDLASVVGAEVSLEPGARVLRLSSFPNPFRPATTIEYDLTAPRQVSLRLFDVSGRLVTTLQDGIVSDSGRQAIRWNGTDGRGQYLAPGVYFCRLEAGDLSATRRLVILR